VSVHRTHLASVVVCLALMGMVAILAGCDSSDSDDLSATVTGIVADASTLYPVAGATIELDGNRSPQSDTQGQFALDQAPVGDQTLLAYATGFATTQVPVTLSSGPNAVGTIYLREGQQSGKGDIVGTLAPYSASLLGATVTGGGKSARTRAVQRTDGTTAVMFFLYNIAPGSVTLQMASADRTMSGSTTVTVVAGRSVEATINSRLSPPVIPSI